MRFFGLVFFSLITLQSIGFSQIPQIVSTSPLQNELNVNKNSNVSIIFNINMDSTSFNDSSAIIYSKHLGYIDGDISYDSSTNTLTIDPSSDFSVGDLITVILTTVIKSYAGIPLDNSFVWSFTVGSSAGTCNFSGPLYYGGYNYPTSITTADLDGDGDLDLATSAGVASPFDDSAATIFNNGDGTFGSYTEFWVVNDWPWTITTNDINRDGDIDLAMSSGYIAYISFLFNNGDSTFSIGSYSTALTSRGIFAAEFNGDGYIDFVITGYSINYIAVVLNDGDGTYTILHYQTPTTGSHRSVFASDFDNDGDFDIVTANYLFNTISVLFNSGDGSISTYTTYAVGDAPTSVFATDLNGDNYIDIVTANSVSNNISVLLNNGLGIFDSSSIYGIVNNHQTKEAITCDIDGDGDQDIIVDSSNDSLAILFNLGDAVFSSPNYLNIPGHWEVKCAADFNGDGVLDLAAARSGSQPIKIILNESLGGCVYFVGDVNGSDSYNGLDITYGVNYLKGGDDPMCPFGSCSIPPCDGFFYCGDVNGSCSYNGLDITYGVNYLKGGDAPMPCPDCPPIN